MFASFKFVACDKICFLRRSKSQFTRNTQNTNSAKSRKSRERRKRNSLRAEASKSRPSKETLFFFRTVLDAGASAVRMRRNAGLAQLASRRQLKRRCKSGLLSVWIVARLQREKRAKSWRASKALRVAQLWNLHFSLSVLLATSNLDKPKQKTLVRRKLQRQTSKLQSPEQVAK